jgi:two-component system CheB/CheR fusion protein
MHKAQRVRQQVEARVLEAFAPAHIVVDAEGDILYHSARTGKYLEPLMGSPRQLLSVVRCGLRPELRSALREAVEKRHQVVRERIEVELADRVQVIRLTIEPMLDAAQEPLYLVVFTDLGPPVSREEVLQYESASVSDDISHPEQEIRERRDLLQATIKKYETALEELKSGNEGLVSVNEELQSTNEELATLKEELQSVNEALHTVNQELGARVEELHRSNADLRNLFESTRIATVFLDRSMSIRSYTPAVTAIFDLIPSDRGRPITDIAHQLEDVDLRRDICQVIDERKPLERPVRLRDGKVFHLMRILPYRNADDEIEGALITFVNVTAVVVAEEQQRLLVRELNHRVRNMLQVVIGLANQTLHKSSDLLDFENAFFGRMQALARAYELLSRDGWRKVPVAELLRTQLAPFIAEGSRYTADGDHQVLAANAALSMGLVIYELATNSTKYGALSLPTGHVQVNWWVEARAGGGKEFILKWSESGGPRVNQPTRHGFGSELVQRQLKYELNGKAVMEFLDTGLVVTLAIPAEEALEAAEAAGAQE